MAGIKVIFIHGNGGGTAKDHWFPYVQEELALSGIHVLARDFPDPVLARASFWLPFLQNELHADEQSILIGHSSGAIAAMRYAENHKIFGSILVGAYYTNGGYDDEKKSGYFDFPWNWEAIRNNQKWIIQYASTDDPFIPIAEAQFVHDQLRSEYHEYTDQGHFGSEGKEKTEFPELLSELKKKLQRS